MNMNEGKSAQHDPSDGLNPFSDEYLDLMDTVTHDRMDEIERGESMTPVMAYERSAISRRRATRAIVNKAMGRSSRNRRIRI